MLSVKKDYEEKSIGFVLPRLAKFIDPKYKIIKTINRISEYSDDPKFFHFGADLFPISNDPKEESLSNNAGGYSFFSEDEALLKCLGEALERSCIRNFIDRNLIKGSYKNLGSRAINPENIVAFSDHQKGKKGFEIFNYDKKSEFYWTKGFDLLNEKEILIPAQLVFLSYKLKEKEKCIYLPISTGAAGGSSITAAIVRGTFEIIERDSFLIYYLNKLPAKRINLKTLKDHKITKVSELIESYNLELYTYYIPTELDIPTFLSIVIDKTNIGPAVSMGLRSDLNAYSAILASIQESMHPRGWVRREIEDNPKLLDTNLTDIDTIIKRAAIWHKKETLKNLDFLLKQKETNINFRKREYSFKEQLDILLETIKKKGMDIFISDVTKDIFRKEGYWVMKVIIPQLQPFYLFENFPCLGGKRLYELPKKLGFRDTYTLEEEINSYPHPFL